jgi:CheY-like chemotaxis protein
MYAAYCTIHIFVPYKGLYMEKTRIFIADDDSIFLGLMKELLDDDGYTATILHIKSEAFEEIKAAQPDLVILDIVMHQPYGGWKLLDMLTLDPQTTAIPVIVCSADSRSLHERADNLRAMGCLAIEKPFDLEVMLSTVYEALNLGERSAPKPTQLVPTLTPGAPTLHSVPALSKDNR